MVRQVVTARVYLCELCEEKYNTEVEAVECERAIFLNPRPHVKVGEFVTLDEKLAGTKHKQGFVVDVTIEQFRQQQNRGISDIPYHVYCIYVATFSGNDAPLAPQDDLGTIGTSVAVYREEDIKPLDIKLSKDAMERVKQSIKDRKERRMQA